MLGDHKAERSGPGMSMRPAGVPGTTQVLYPGMRRVRQNALINTKNRSHSITAELEIPDLGAKGVIISQSDTMGGWSFYVHDGRLKYHYNFVGALRSEVVSTVTLPAGTHEVRMESSYDGGGLGRGTTVSLYIDGKKIGEGRVKRTHALFFSTSETLEVGRDRGEPVSPDYGPHENEFTGKIHWVRIDIEDAPKESFRASRSSGQLMLGLLPQ